MTTTRESSAATGDAQRAGNITVAATLVGLVGGLACSLAMVFSAVGIFGAAAGGAASMSDMVSGHHAGTSAGRNGVWDFLIDHGPTILVVSIALVTTALALRRRPSAAIAAGVLGTVMYWGMYEQTQVATMYFTIAAGLIGWLALILVARRPRMST